MAAPVKPDLWFHAEGIRIGVGDGTIPTMFLGMEQRIARSVDINLASLQFRLNELFKENPSWRNKTFMMAIVSSQGKFQDWTETYKSGDKAAQALIQTNYIFWAKETNYEEAHRVALPASNTTPWRQYRPYYASGDGVNNYTAFYANDNSNAWEYASQVDSGQTIGGEFRVGISPVDVSCNRFPLLASYATFEDLITYLETFPVCRVGGTKYITRTDIESNSPWKTTKNAYISAIIYSPNLTADNTVSREGSVNNSGTKTYATKVQYFKGDPYDEPGSNVPVEVPPSGLPGFPEYVEDVDTFEGAFARAQLGQDIYKIAAQNPQLFLVYGHQLIQANTFTKTRAYR